LAAFLYIVNTSVLFFVLFLVITVLLTIFVDITTLLGKNFIRILFDEITFFVIHIFADNTVNFGVDYSHL